MWITEDYRAKNIVLVCVCRNTEKNDEVRFRLGYLLRCQ